MWLHATWYGHALEYHTDQRYGKTTHITNKNREGTVKMKLGFQGGANYLSFYHTR